MPRNVKSLELSVHSRKKSVNRELVTQNRCLWRHGFTLIELLVVITIIAILIASASASWQNAQMKGRDGKRKTDLKAVQQALENYLQVNGTYPSSNAGGQIVCTVGIEPPSVWGSSAFICNSITFMQQMPKDSVYQATTGYYFASCNTPPTSYVLSALLENTSDPDLSGLSSTCSSPPAGRNYWVTNP